MQWDELAVITRRYVRDLDDSRPPSGPEYLSCCCRWNWKGLGVSTLRSSLAAPEQFEKLMLATRVARCCLHTCKATVVVECSLLLRCEAD